MAKRQTTAADVLHAHVARVTDANTNAPAGYAAACPVCGEPSNATLVAAWGHCMACHRSDWSQRVAARQGQAR